MASSRWLLLRYFVVLSLVALRLDSIGTASAQTEAAVEHEFGIDLYALTETELEQICTDLGFALQKDALDDSTGEVIVFSHSDYVEAARQCLSIEKELAEVLAEHPEILEEMEAERKRMTEEKERLEKELEEVKQKQSASNELPLSAAFVTGSMENEDSTATADTAATEILEEAIETLKTNETTVNESQSEIALDEQKGTQSLLEVLDELFLGPLPPPVQEFVRKVLIQLNDDGRRVLRLIRRHMNPLIGQLIRTIHSRINGEKSAPDGVAVAEALSQKDSVTESTVPVESTSAV